MSDEGVLLALSMLAFWGKPAPAGAATHPKPAAKDCTGIATFGAGCFWCVEAVFQEIEGVCTVEPGYAGGKHANPSYEEVCTGESGHAEVARIRFDPAKVTYAELLEVFWQTHDPTTLNRQGSDAGTQYRSVIFAHDAEQKKAAAHYKRELEKSGAYSKPIVTEIVPFKAFYPAEDYHKNYYRTHTMAPYCVFVIRPKLDKLHKAFKKKIRRPS